MMKSITTILAALGLTLGLATTASAALTTPTTALNDQAALAQIAKQATTAPTIQLAARSIIRNGRSFRRAGRYGRRWVRGNVGPRRVWSGRNNRTAGRHYNPTRRYQIQRRISRHRRHF